MRKSEEVSVELVPDAFNKKATRLHSKERREIFFSRPVVSSMPCRLYATDCRAPTSASDAAAAAAAAAAPK